jgi:hypothetical protein
MRGPSTRPSTGLSAVLGLLGLALILAGTFLPWLRSGEVNRDSYSSAGSLERLVDVHGWPAVLISAWPFLGLGCACVAAVFALGMPRAAAVAALVPAFLAGTISVAALVAPTGRFVAAVATGPAVTLVGATVVLLAVTLVLTASRTQRARSREA